MQLRFYKLEPQHQSIMKNKIVLYEEKKTLSRSYTICYCKNPNIWKYKIPNSRRWAINWVLNSDILKQLKHTKIFTFTYYIMMLRKSKTVFSFQKFFVALIQIPGIFIDTAPIVWLNSDLISKKESIYLFLSLNHPKSCWSG